MSNELKRKLGLSAAIALSVGSTIGSGIFSSVSQVAGASGSALITILSFFVGGLIMIPQNMVYAELATAFPEDGAHYIYLKEAGLKPLAFLMGWACFWANDSATISILALATIQYVAYLFPMGDLTVKLLAVLLVILLMALHIRSVEKGGRFQTVITFGKIAIFAAIIGIGIFFVKGAFLSVPAAKSAPRGIAALLAGISATSWSYDGMAACCYMTGEIKDPKKTMPRALIGSGLIIILIYTFVAVIVTGMIPFKSLVASSAPIADALGTMPLFGNLSGNIVAVAGAIVILGALSSAIMFQPRLEYVMAKDGLFFKAFQKVHPKYETPYMSIAFQCAIAIVLIFASNITTLLGYFTLVLLFKNALTFCTVFIHRRRNGYNPLWKMPLWRVNTVIAISTSLLLIVSEFLWAPLPGIIAGVIVVASGLPVYYIWEKRNKSNKAASEN